MGRPPASDSAARRNRSKRVSNSACSSRSEHNTRRSAEVNSSRSPISIASRARNMSISSPGPMEKPWERRARQNRSRCSTRSGFIGEDETMDGSPPLCGAGKQRSSRRADSPQFLTPASRSKSPLSSSPSRVSQSS